MVRGIVEDKDVAPTSIIRANMHRTFSRRRTFAFFGAFRRKSMLQKTADKILFPFLNTAQPVDQIQIARNIFIVLRK